MDPSSYRVHVIILNYRTPQLVVRGLEVLETEVAALGDGRVTVVDGGSGDDSASILRAAIQERGWGSWCELVALADNRGFAAGNNAVVRPLLASERPPDFFHLLNPDTEIRPGAVIRLRDFLVGQPDVGIAGSRLEDPDGTPQISAFRFPSLSSEVLDGLSLGAVERRWADRTVHMPIPDHTTRVDWVAGASMMIRREVFEDVGLMDEGYFLYFEEVDFCLAAARAQWPTYYVPDSRVMHLVGQSTQVSDERRQRGRIPRYWFESRARFFTKNHGRLKRRLADVTFTAAYATRRLRQKLMGEPNRDPPRRLRDFVNFSFMPEYEPARHPIGPSRGGRPPLADRGRYNGNPTDIGLLPLLKEDFDTYDRNLLEQGLWAVVMHRLGNANQSVRWLPVRAPLEVLHRLGEKLVEVTAGISLPATVQVGRRVRIWHHSGIVLHADRIGDDVTIRHLTTFGVRHDDDLESIPVIGDRVDLGVGVTVIGAVYIGNDAKVGAHAVVTKDVPAGAVVGGVPAKRIDGGPSEDGVRPEASDAPAKIAIAE